MSRLTPLPLGSVPELDDLFAPYYKQGYAPNSQLILQRKPKIVRALREMSNAILDPDGEVPMGLKRLVGYVASRTHGCHY